MVIGLYNAFGIASDDDLDATSAGFTGNSHYQDGGNTSTVSPLSTLMLSLTASLASSQLASTVNGGSSSSSLNVGQFDDGPVGSVFSELSNNELAEQFPTISTECHDSSFESMINFTQFNFPGTGRTKVFGVDEYFKITLYVCAMLASLFGNLAVVLAVAMKRTLRVTVNLYLANLAVADILICVCCMWVHLTNHLTAPAYVLGPLLCRLNGFTQMTCLTSSVLTLSAISCDRYMAIMFPLRSRVTKKRTDAVIAVIWICSLAISTPFFLFRRLQTLYWSDYTETNCLEAWPSTTFYSPEAGRCIKEHTFKRVYYTLVSTTLFFVPVFVMVMAYSAIIWKLWVNKVPGEAHYANIRQQKKSKRKVIQMVVVVVFCFVACWLPLQIVILFSLYVHNTDDGVLPAWFPSMSYYATFIAYSNSAFNPLIYGGFNKNFRDALCNNVFCGLWFKGRRLKRPRHTTACDICDRVSTNSVRNTMCCLKFSKCCIPDTLDEYNRRVSYEDALGHSNYPARVHVPHTAAGSGNVAAARKAAKSSRRSSASQKNVKKRRAANKRRTKPRQRKASERVITIESW